MHHWALTIRVNGKVTTRNHYRTKKFAQTNLERILIQGVQIYSPNKKIPLRFSYSLLKVPGKLPNYQRRPLG